MDGVLKLFGIVIAMTMAGAAAYVVILLALLTRHRLPDRLPAGGEER